MVFDRAVFLLEKLCLAHATIVFSTVSSSGRSILQSARKGEVKKGDVQCSEASHGAPGSPRAMPFDVCIIDEAGQLVEAETAIVLQVWRDVLCLGWAVPCRAALCRAELCCDVLCFAESACTGITDWVRTSCH